MNTFVLVWHRWEKNTPIDRQVILDHLGQMTTVQMWRAAVGAVFIGSNYSETQIAQELAERMPSLTFIVSQISTVTSQGRADVETWEFLADPTRIKPTT